MKQTEYLDAAKTRLRLQSDYGLAKRLECLPNHVSEIRAGKRTMPLDVAYRLAIILELDPAQVVAELEGEREKNPVRAEFWRSFLSRAAALAVTVACTLAWSFSGISGGGQDGGFSGTRRRRQCA